MPRKSHLFLIVFLVSLPAAIGGNYVSSMNISVAAVQQETIGAGFCESLNRLPDHCCPEEQVQPEIKLTIPYMQGSQIAEYQVALQKLGYYKGKIDGVYSPATAKSVQEFQRRNKLKDDGVIGVKTKQALAGQFEAGAADTVKQAAPKGVVEILIDIDRKKLTVYDNKKIFKEYDVAVGKDRTPTPVGEWKITRKAMHWGTGFGTRWLGLNVPWGLYGIHGTNKPWSIGTEASAGCIRMMNHDVEELYPWVQTGTAVRIIGEVYPPLYEDREKVHKGHRGTVVVLVQQGLAAEGYLKGKPDGIFGPATEEALKKLQKDKGFEVTGQVDVDIWPVLGL